MWKPIETAPLDGTPLLLYVPGVTSWNRKNGLPDIVVGAFLPTMYQYIAEDGSFTQGAWFSDIGDVDQGYESTGAYFEHEHLRPTHWHALPSLPSDQ